MKIQYRPKGVCSLNITFDLEDGIVRNVQFTGGCSGNTQGIMRLVEGMKASQVVEKLKDIKCGFKETSCPDQLARAVEGAILEAEKREPEKKPA